MTTPSEFDLKNYFTAGLLREGQMMKSRQARAAPGAAHEVLISMGEFNGRNGCVFLPTESSELLNARNFDPRRGTTLCSSGLSLSLNS
ncbi:hypothetical protein AVEN_52307-1 [Araneus ventricosus]|uniref:Uncharacterized protein n=1 Tax=Araneus ventricosus TaxID=182803 RepID=A0A4Y2GHF3_ARAVE|nr:hypothetical protein AVEN_52307-1 [Araneus ventricosus]